MPTSNNDGHQIPSLNDTTLSAKTKQTWASGTKPDVHAVESAYVTGLYVAYSTGLSSASPRFTLLIIKNAESIQSAAKRKIPL